MKRTLFALAVLSALVARSAATNGSVESGEPPFKPLVVDVSGKPADGLFTYNFWRILSSIEKTNGVSRICKIWKDATTCQEIPDGCDSSMEITELKDGRYYVDWTFTVVATNLPPLPRVGIAFPIKKSFTNVRWNGFGPWENYPSHRNAAKFGTYAANMSLVDDGSLNFGYRSACRWVEIAEPMGKGMRIDAVNAPFGFSIRPHAKASEGFFVHIDAYISSGLSPDSTVQNAPQTYRLSLLMSEL